MAQRVIVIGAGIIGVSIGLHLAKAGAEVRIFDARPCPGGVATPNSWAWINASWGNDPAYFRLRHHAMKLWRALDATVPGLNANWPGGLLWDLPQDKLEAYVAERQGQGYAIRLLSKAEIAAREPHLAAPPDVAALAEEEGSVEPVHAVEKIAAAAESAGADLTSDAPVKWLVYDGERITGVMMPDGFLSADHVVVAAGVETARLLDGIGLTLALEQPAGLLAYSEPASELLRSLVMAPELHVRQTAEGRLVAGADFGGADPGLDPEAAAAALHAKVQTLIRGAAQVALSHHTIGHRPTPRDGLPCVGVVPGIEGLSLAVTHSGVTLAPAIGAMLAAEITKGLRDPLLAPYGPGRLLSRT